MSIFLRNRQTCLALLHESANTLYETKLKGDDVDNN